MTKKGKMPVMKVLPGTTAACIPLAATKVNSGLKLGKLCDAASKEFWDYYISKFETITLFFCFSHIPYLQPPKSILASNFANPVMLLLKNFGTTTYQNLKPLP